MARAGKAARGCAGFALCFVLAVTTGCSGSSVDQSASGGGTATSPSAVSAFASNAAASTPVLSTGADETTASGVGSGASSTPPAGTGPSDQSAFAAPRAVPPGMGSGAPAGQFPRTVAHFGGSTTIPASPVRTIVISTGQLDATLTLGVVPVGSTRGDGSLLVPPYLTAAFAEQENELNAMQDLGLRLEPNVEAIAAAQPDLILVNAAGAEGIYDQLEQIAPTVQTEGTGVNWKQDFLLVADALGRTAEAQDYLDAFHQQAQQFAQELTTPPTVSFVRTTSDRTRIFGVPSFAGSIAQDAGLARPATQLFDKTSEDLSPEQIAGADADWIFYGLQTGADAMSANPLWPTLAAVQAGRVVDVDDDPWYLNAGPTAAAVVLAQLMETIGG